MTGVQTCALPILLGEHGFVGLSLFLLLGFLTFTTGTWIINQTKNNTDLSWAHDLAAMLQVSLIGYAIGGTFLGLAYYYLPYSLLAILVITKCAVIDQNGTNKSGKIIIPPVNI